MMLDEGSGKTWAWGQKETSFEFNMCKKIRAKQHLMHSTVSIN
jgi:hypothetical protein